MKNSSFTSDWKIVICRLNLVSLMVTLLSSTIEAQEPEPETEEAPSLDFLEFLRQWETSADEWLDLNEIDDIDYTKYQIDVAEKGEEVEPDS